jgi:hypothetical protein
MDGLAMEALILYDEVIGDPRILPSIERCLQWTWGTQWVDAARAFLYADITSGSVNTNPYANLNGLLLPAWDTRTRKLATRPIARRVNAFWMVSLTPASNRCGASSNSLRCLDRRAAISDTWSPGPGPRS